MIGVFLPVDCQGGGEDRIQSEISFLELSCNGPVSSPGWTAVNTGRETNYFQNKSWVPAESESWAW